MPFLLSGSAITIIGAAWVYTLDIGSPASHLVGYQVIIGIGIGISVQIPIIANQAMVEMSEISSVSALTLCTSPPYSSITESLMIKLGGTDMMQSSKLSVEPSASLLPRALSQIAFYPAFSSPHRA